MIPGERITVRDEAELVDVGRIYYDRNLEPDKSGTYVLPEMLSSSDYANTGILGISNHRVFMEQFAESQGEEWWDVYGSYGYTGILIRRDADERVPEMREFFEHLENYPVADEDDWSELESETRWAQWSEPRGGRNDFMNALESVFTSFDEIELDHDAVDALWRSATDYVNGGEEGLNEQGDQWYFGSHIERIIESLNEFAQDFSPPGAEDDSEGQRVLWDLLQLDERDGQFIRFDYGQRVGTILRNHHRMNAQQRAVLQDIIQEDGVEGGLAFLEFGKRLKRGVLSGASRKRRR